MKKPITKKDLTFCQVIRHLAYMYCSAQQCLALSQSLAYLLGFVPWLSGAELVTSHFHSY